MTFNQLCKEISMREKAKGREVNITEIRTVLRHFFEVMVGMDVSEKKGFLFPRATEFFWEYLKYYRAKHLKKKKKIKSP